MSINEVIEVLENGDSVKLKEMINEWLEEGLDPTDIINNKLLVAMEDIGARFKQNLLFIPEVLVSARAMNAALEILAPNLSADDPSYKGKVVLGTVKDDLHDIGKNLVKMTFKSNCFEVIDLGIDVSEEQFIKAVKEHKPQIVALSALLTNTLHQMELVIKKLESEGLRDKVKVIVGGAPVSEGFANSIGADGYAPDAVSGVSLAVSVTKS